MFLYYDDLELCNPLGSRRTIHKIGTEFLIMNIRNLFLYTGAFYFTLGNCSPKLRSDLRSIQLVALVKNSLIKKYGMNTVLKPIVKDLKALVSVHVRTLYWCALNRRSWFSNFFIGGWLWVHCIWVSKTLLWHFVCCVSRQPSKLCTWGVQGKYFSLSSMSPVLGH